MHWGGGVSWNDVWDELGMGDWMSWLFSGGGGGGGGGQRWMEQSAAAGAQQRGGGVVVEPRPRSPEWIWDERFRRWVRTLPPLVRNVGPVMFSS